jgi:hypothetical protein
MIQPEIYDLHMKPNIRGPGAVEILMSDRKHYRLKQQLSFENIFYKLISNMAPLWITLAK